MLNAKKLQTKIGFWPVAGLFIVLNSTGSFAGADSGQFGHNEWSGGAYFSKTTKNFTHCAMTAAYPSGTVLGFAYYSSGLVVMLGNPKWKVDEKETYDVTISVDGKWELRTKAIPRRTKTWIVDIPVGESVGALESMRYGHTLQIQTARDLMTYKLNGTAVALQKLYGCYLANRQATPNLAFERPSNPFAPKTVAPSFGSERPVSKQTPTTLQTMQSRQQSSAKSPEFAELAKWTSHAHSIADDFYRVIKLVTSAEDVGDAYLNKKVTEDYARRQSASLLYEAQSVLTEGEKKLQSLANPPAFPRRPSLGPDTKRFLHQFRDQIRTMIVDAKQGLLAAFSGDEDAHTAIMTRQFARYVILLKSENLQLDLANTDIDNEIPQLYLNDSIKNANDALIQIFGGLRSILDKTKLTDLDGAARSATYALQNMESSIEQGRHVLQQSKERIAAQLRTKPELSQSFDDLLQVYKDAFDVEEEIATAISSMTRDFGSLVGSTQHANLESVGDKWQILGLEIEQLVNKRVNLGKRRIEIVGTMKFH